MSASLLTRTAAAALLFLATGTALAQAFSAQVLPPRFEDAVKAGETYRNVIEIQNSSKVGARFIMRTADWSLAADGSAQFEYALAPGSCRPWVGIEANEVRLDPNSSRRFRFEVSVPPGTPPGQCRFAVMIEGEPQADANGLPVAGRIGVIVYLNIGGAAAQLEVIGVQVITEEGKDLPALSVRNTGNAHGRLEGFIDGIDAAGQRWTLVPAYDPVMPGATRLLPLRPAADVDAEAPARISFPMTIKGQLDWGSQRIPVEATAAR